MGFLENLRREQAARDQRNREHEQQLANARSERDARENARLSEAENEAQRRLDQARRYQEQSGVITLLDNFHDALGSRASDRRAVDARPGSIAYLIEWDRIWTDPAQTGYHSSYKRNYRASGLIAITDYQGTIKFDAGFLGRSNINRNEWQHNPRQLEKAIEKAYKHPTKIMHYVEYSSHQDPYWYQKYL